MMKKQIPNIITLLNVLCGSLAVYSIAVQDNIIQACVFILAGMVFDFFDGMTARLLHVQSDMGKELDSLADVVSFGVAPSLVAFYLMKNALVSQSFIAEDSMFYMFCLFSAFLMPPMSAYRLAKFNLDTRQTTSFLGLPTPANALFWVGLAFGSVYTTEFYNTIFGRPLVLLLFIWLLSVLLITDLPMFSLKIHGFGWKENKIRYIFLGIIILLFVVFGKAVVWMIIPLYILICVVVYLASNLLVNSRKKEK